MGTFATDIFYISTCFSDYLRPYLLRHKDLFGDSEEGQKIGSRCLEEQQGKFLEVFLPTVLAAFQDR